MNRRLLGVLLGLALVGSGIWIAWGAFGGKRLKIKASEAPQAEVGVE